jgi:hypothetical protein
MPELHSGMTQQYRAFHASKKVDLGRKIEEFIAQAIPDVVHIWVLSRLVGVGRDGATMKQLGLGIDAPKSAVAAALERFEKLGLARSRRRLLSKTYTFSREEAKADLALRVVKLWSHPQAHASVLQAIAKHSGGSGKK